MADEQWAVVAEPVGRNAELKPEAAARLGRTRLTGGDADKNKDNVGGVVVYVAKGLRKEEVARVGFVREASENPKDKFEDKLDEIIAVAEKTRDTLNQLVVDGELQ